MHTRPRSGMVLAFTASIGVAGACAGAPLVDLGGVSFLDRAARGEIVLGNIRGSVGVIDYDNDGWYDLFIADVAGAPKRLFHNTPSAGTPGGRTFVDVSVQSGVADADGQGRGFGGVVILDFNNDGFSDIYTLGNGSDGKSGLLYMNNGNGTFTNVSIAAGVRLSGASQNCVSAVDFDHDGFIDLFIVNSGSPGRTLVLLRNNGDGTFTDRSMLLPPVAFTGTTYAHAFTDYDHDGWEDCMVCLNSATPLMLKNVANPAGGRMFVDATAASGFTVVGPAPMGIALGDFDGDGWIDAAITDAVSGTYYRNNGGVFAQIFPYSTFFGWGTTWLDAENDGDLDNYQAGSYGGSNVDFLLRNDGAGGWTDARAALNTPARPSQQCARVDFDNDGREDIITVNPGQFVSIYHNQSSASNGWSTVRLVGRAGVNRDAAGAVVRLTAGGRTQVREIVLGSSYSAGEDPRAHFGLGAAGAVDRIEVVWPRAGTIAARTDVFTGPLAANSILTITSRPACAGDFNGSGAASPQDVFDFLGAWFAREPNADANGRDGVTTQDIFDFLAAWFQGC